MNDEVFFSQVKSKLEAYSPTAPEEIYGKMRKKLWWNNFTRLSLTRFNVWYILLFCGLATGFVLNQDSPSADKTTEAAEAANPHIVPVVTPISESNEDNIARVETVEEHTTTTPTQPSVNTQQVRVSSPASTSKTSITSIADISIDEIEIPEEGVILMTEDNDTIQTNGEDAEDTASPSTEKNNSDSGNEAGPKKRKVTIDVIQDPDQHIDEDEN